MSTILIELTDEQMAQFEGPARVLGVPAVEVARKSIEEFLSRRDEEMRLIIDEIVAERAQVLRRLAEA